MPKSQKHTSACLYNEHSISRRSALKLAFGAGIVSLIGAHGAYADEYEASQETLDALADAQNQADAIQSQLDSIGAEIQALAEEYESTLSQVEEINTRIDEKESEINQTQEEIDATTTEIEAAEEEIKKHQAEIKVAQERLSARMASAYKSGPQGVVDFLLSAASFEEFTSNIYYLDKISAADEQMIGDIKELKEQIEALKAQLEAQRNELENKKAEIEAAKVELESAKAELETIKVAQEEQLSTMQAKQSEVFSILDDINDQVAELLAQRDSEILEARREAERMAAARAAAASSSSSSSSSSASTVYYSEPAVSSGTTGSQQRVINSAYSTPTAGAGLCAAWITYVFINAGVGSFGGNACDMYWWYCTSSNTANLQPGMIIAVPSHPHTSAGSIYGHIGVYVGNGTVRHNIGYIATWSLSEWINYYGATTTPRWGWLGGVALA